ncbi:transporter [Serinibacter arcticus]|uniref:Transporter n=1 Tax=Serinibacter arcticus TaxID=1655435 RepID=A0A2U1ZV29_9MICO|nr:sugar ABC transporter permease [Serinibacter arcticus]PWD50829.1 transporter [Serinibacter arcticus]
MTTLAPTSTPEPASPPGDAPGRAKRQGAASRAQRREALALVVPATLPILVFSIIPLVTGIYLGFTNSTLKRNPTNDFTGLENYQRLIGDTFFWESFRIGLIWAASVAVLTLLAALGLALLLNADLRLKGVTRVLALIPWAMPPVVVAIVWRLIYSPTAGPLNAGLGFFGIEGVNWLGDFSTALPAVIVVAVWSGIPQSTVLLLAGLQQVPTEQHEAAAVDGASALRRFWHITLPALRPVIFAITSLDFIWSFNSFGLVYVLTEGGPGGRTMLPMLFTYLEAFTNRNTGYAAAMGNVMVLAVVIVLSAYLFAQFRRGKAAQS